jgi:hypothetical protein
MPEKTYKIIEVVGVSEESIHLAVRNALARRVRPCTISIGLRSKGFAARSARMVRRHFRSKCGSVSDSREVRSEKLSRSKSSRSGFLQRGRGKESDEAENQTFR